MEAVEAYRQSAVLLVETIRLKMTEDKPSRSAYKIKEFVSTSSTLHSPVHSVSANWTPLVCRQYDLCVARIDELCAAQRWTPPQIQQPPTLIPLTPSGPQPPPSLAVQPDTPGTPAPSKSMGLLKRQIQELLSLWQHIWYLSDS